MRLRRVIEVLFSVEECQREDELLQERVHVVLIGRNSLFGWCLRPVLTRGYVSGGLWPSLKIFEARGRNTRTVWACIAYSAMESQEASKLLPPLFCAIAGLPFSSSTTANHSCFSLDFKVWSLAEVQQTFKVYGETTSHYFQISLVHEARANHGQYLPILRSINITWSGISIIIPSNYKDLNSNLAPIYTYADVQRRKVNLASIWSCDRFDGFVDLISHLLQHQSQTTRNQTYSLDLFIFMACVRESCRPLWS